MLIMDLGMLAFGILKGWAATKLKTYLYFLKISSWKHIFSIRKKVKSYRRITDKEATRNFAGKILFQEIDNPVLKIVNPIFNVYWQAVKLLIFW